uniref:testis-specific serine/threonine-protein kinase 6-like n=1 Tax=Styela clava TaxID=7725 RepID=UPI00193950DB|nr:testis-specific serine/threonine-protein kinase 6-like [Styela clava]
MAGMREEDVWLRRAGYLLGERFSGGSFSTIHLALRIRDASKVAVKLIDLRTTTQDYRKRFLPREIENVATLHHPNIIKVQWVGRSKTKAYIIMAHAKTNLRQQIAKRSFIDETQAKKWFCQLASAMAYLHRRGVAHRDLKIENILIDEEQNIKLCDFGFSKVCQQNGNLGPNSDTFCGSLGYCAPEILLRTPYNPWKTDIWSLGVVLYKMVIGGMPFGEGNDLGCIRKIAKAQTQLLEFPDHPRITDDCQNLIRSLLAFESEHRITLVDIFRSKWINADGLSCVDTNSLSHVSRVIQETNNLRVQETNNRAIAREQFVNSSQQPSSDRPKTSIRPTSVISRIRMRLPSLSTRRFRKERL